MDELAKLRQQLAGCKQIIAQAHDNIAAVESALEEARRQQPILQREKHALDRFSAIVVGNDSSAELDHALAELREAREARLALSLPNLEDAKEHLRVTLHRLARTAAEVSESKDWKLTVDPTVMEDGTGIVFFALRRTANQDLGRVRYSHRHLRPLIRELLSAGKDLRWFLERLQETQDPATIARELEPYWLAVKSQTKFSAVIATVRACVKGAEQLGLPNADSGLAEHYLELKELHDKYVTTYRLDLADSQLSLAEQQDLLGRAPKNIES